MTRSRHARHVTGARHRSRRPGRATGILLLAVLTAIGPTLTLIIPHTSPDTMPAHGAPVRTVGRDDTDATADRGLPRTGRGSWGIEPTPDPDTLTLRHAANPTIRTLINTRDKTATPAAWDPDHPTGDTGRNEYPEGQCTWWAYERRRQLGLPVASRMGDAKDWAGSARRSGYWVDSTPRQWDVAVFQPGQEGADRRYGHVAIVEQVGTDGGIRVSEMNVDGRPGVSRRILDAKAASQLEYIHY